MRITEQEIKKLKRNELCDLLLEQVKVNEEVQENVNIQEEKLAERKVQLDKAGTIAEACFNMNGVLEAAEKAAQQYLENIEMLNARQEEICAQKEEETNVKVAKMLVDTERTCIEKKRVTNEECEQKVKEAEAYLIAQTAEADAYYTEKTKEGNAYYSEKSNEADSYYAVKKNEADSYYAVKINEADVYHSDKTRKTNENCASMQAAADQNCAAQLAEMEEKCAEMLESTKRKCAEMELVTEARIEKRWEELSDKLEAFIDAHEGLRGLLASAGIQSNML